MDLGFGRRFGVVLAMGLALLAGPAVAQAETFSYSGAKVTWSPPVTGTYRVTAVGGRGGASTVNSEQSGGYGAEISASFTLTAGTIYSVAVGQAGDSDVQAGGGGGASFFVETGLEGIPLLVAAGGGGGSHFAGGGSAEASFFSSGPGLGGGGQPRSAGGAGFYGDGQDGGTGISGGGSWGNGLAGGSGDPGSGSVKGGYGGGGGGAGGGMNTHDMSGGGGGGYSGGDGAWGGNGWASPGTSFSVGDDTMVSTATAGGDGSLSIEFIPDLPDDSSDAAEASIANFIATRNQLLLATAPDVGRFIDRFDGGGGAPGAVNILGYSATTDLPLELRVGSDAAHFRYSSAYQHSSAGSALEDGRLLDDYSPALGAMDAVTVSDSVEKLALWAEGSFARASDDTVFGVVHVGGDYLLTDRVLVGIAGAVDSMRRGGATELSGTGYTVGPYVTVKLSDQLFLDARVAGGQSFNEITQPGADTDSFTGTRWLASTELVGRFDAGMVRIEPSARLAAATETTEAYIDHNGDEVGSVTSTTATAEIGPRFSLVPDEQGGLAPYLGLAGTWTFFSDSTTGPEEGSVRGRVEAGATLGSADGLSAEARAFYDGIGSEWRAWGASLGVNAALK